MINYFKYFVELTQLERITTALFIILMMAILNYMGRAPAGFYQRLTTVLKVSGLMLLVVLGFTLDYGGENLLGTTEAPTGTLGPIGNIIAAFMVVFAHMGFERVGYAAGEMKDPRRTIPLTMFVGITAIVLIYVQANLLYHQTLGMEEVRTSSIVASDTAVLLLGPLDAGFIAVTVMISTTGKHERDLHDRHAGLLRHSAGRTLLQMAGLQSSSLPHTLPGHHRPCRMGIGYSALPGDLRDDHGGHGFRGTYLLRGQYSGPLQTAPHVRR